MKKSAKKYLPLFCALLMAALLAPAATAQEASAKKENAPAATKGAAPEASRRAGRGAPAHPLLIESLTGPITANEIAAFKAFMGDQRMPPTPWGAGHNAWAFGGGGRNLEALGMMVELTGDVEILNTMIAWADECVSQRNDLMPADKGGQRKMWTGDIDKTWCPEAPNAKNALYSGCETEDTIAHIIYCSKLILQHPELAQKEVPGGDPKGYGKTYLDRAKTYIAKCDESNDDYFVKYFIQKETNLIRDPDNQPEWKKINNNLNAINRQMMFDGGFQRLAECHEILGDAPERVKKYDAIVKASIDECMKCITTFKVSEVKGHKTYDWPYFPWSTKGSESTGHAAYDVLGIYRAFQRPAYGMKLEDVKPIANTMAYVIAKDDGTFAATIDGKGSLGAGRGFNFGEWILLADWNPDVYDAIAKPNLESGAYKTNANLTASTLWARTRLGKTSTVGEVPAPASVPAKGDPTEGAQPAAAKAEPKPVVPDGVELITDVEIGTGGGSRLHVDIFRPKSPPATPMPAVLWVHGGAWNSGSHHRTYQYQNLAAQGYFVASVEYRLVPHGQPASIPQGVWPGPLEDCKLAVRWLRANAAKYNVDPDKIGCWGASAGGHLVELMGLTDGHSEFEGTGGYPGVSSKVQAVVAFCSPSDMTGEWATDATHALAADPNHEKNEIDKQMSPIAYVEPGNKTAAPILIVQGDKDQLVPIAHSLRLDEAMTKAGMEHELIVIKGGRHGYTMRAEAGQPAADPDPQAVYDRVKAFFDKHLK